MGGAQDVLHGGGERLRGRGRKRRLRRVRCGRAGGFCALCAFASAQELDHARPAAALHRAPGRNGHRQAGRAAYRGELEALYKLRARPGAEGFAEAWDRAVYAGMQRVEDAGRFIAAYRFAT